MIKNILILIFVFALLANSAYSVTEIVVNETDLVSLKPKAADPDQDRLVYSFSSPLNENGQWQTAYGDAGQYTITVTVSDGEASTSQDVLLAVNKKEEPPAIDSFTPPEKEISLYEGETLKFELTASDLNNDPLAYEWLLNGNVVSDNNSFIYTPLYDEAGTYSLEANVSDSKSTVANEWEITVNNSDRPPIFKKIGNIIMKENQEVAIMLEASDQDGDIVRFSALNTPEGSSFPEENKFVWHPNYETVKKLNLPHILLDKLHLLSKTFDVTFIAENSLKTEQLVKIKVMDVNRDFTLDGIAPVTANEGETITITPSASDPDGDKISYSFSGWMNRAGYKANYDDAGTHTVTVTASDGYHKHQKDVAITVNDANQAPVFEPVKSLTIKENSLLELTINAKDNDGDLITYSAEELPQNSTFTDNLFKWTPGYETTKGKDNFILKFKASDSILEAEQNVNITVLDTNRKPVILNATPSNLIVYKSLPILLGVYASDPDGDELEYKWKFNLLESFNGTNFHQRIFTAPGDKKISLVISDGRDSIDYKWNIKVI